MYYQRLGHEILVRLERGEELCASLLALAEKERVPLARVSGLGAADHGVVGLYRLEEQEFSPVVLDRPLEICTVTGSLTQKEGRPHLHLHGVLADETGGCWGGHLKEVRISATAELFLTLLPGTVERLRDEKLGLDLWDLPQRGEEDKE